MKAVLTAVVVTAIAVGILVWAFVYMRPNSVWFAFFVVWVPMTWLGTIGRVARPRLPSAFHRLRPVEADGRVYERLGVGAAKRLLRRGPLATFNPDLHLPFEPTPERVAFLDRRMRDAEASHAILFVVTAGIALHAVLRGWWAAALATMVFDVLMNGYPVMLQRYNRALLARRFGPPAAPTPRTP
jgi:hypothetical protein